jgi:hypothetical protein
MAINEVAGTDRSTIKNVTKNMKEYMQNFKKDFFLRHVTYMQNESFHNTLHSVNGVL